MNSKYNALQVLVIDDDPIILELVEIVLTQIGVGEVLKATNVQSALASFSAKRNTTDLIICDWIMPGISGLKFLELVREIDKTVPFLMLTSKADERSVMEAQEFGVTRYVIKPFTPKKLRKDIEKMLQQIILD
jgi:two-component system, chemotaxis family, chemotaxis protein CheY